MNPKNTHQNAIENELPLTNREREKSQNEIVKAKQKQRKTCVHVTRGVSNTRTNIVFSLRGNEGKLLEKYLHSSLQLALDNNNKRHLLTDCVYYLQCFFHSLTSSGCFCNAVCSKYIILSFTSIGLSCVITLNRILFCTP